MPVWRNHLEIFVDRPQNRPRFLYDNYKLLRISLLELKLKSVRRFIYPRPFKELPWSKECDLRRLYESYYAGMIVPALLQFIEKVETKKLATRIKNIFCLIKLFVNKGN